MGGGSSAESSDEEDQIKDHLKDSSLSSDKSSDSVFSDSPGSTVKATIESNSKMEIDDDCNNDDEWAELNHRDSSSGSDVIESGSVSGEVAMDTGNPWDSKPLAASTVTPFDNPFDSPAKSSGGINPNPNPKVDEGWA